MLKLQTLEHHVQQLYAHKSPGRSPWTDWLAVHHVFVVADKATELAQRFGANQELARAAALLHDIADVKLNRSSDKHEQTSLDMARTLMEQAGYDEKNIGLVVDDAIRYHSCHDGNIPTSQEGKVLATADALAHLQTDFYIFATWMMSKENKELDVVKEWTLKKIERDFHDKIQFNEVRDECREDYAAIKRLFSH